MVASFGKTYVTVGDRRIDLPNYVAGRHDGRTAAPTYGDTCPHLLPRDADHRHLRRLRLSETRTT